MLKLKALTICLCAVSIAAGLAPSVVAAEENAEEIAEAKVAAQADLAAFQRDVQPVLKQLCVSCHGPDKEEANLRLDLLDPDLVNGPDAESWHDVLNRMNQGEMPPEGSPQLNEAQQAKVVGWLTGQLRKVEEYKRGTGGQVVLRRLTRYEYNNTMRALLGVDLDFASDLPPEPPSADGFQNNGASLGISALQVEMYLQSARAGLEKAIVVGEKPQVFTHHAEEGLPLRNKNAIVSNKLGWKGQFLARMMEFPREGEMVIRVRAGAVIPDGAPYPRMQVTIGVRADVLSPEKTLAEVDVTASVDAPQTFEFRGRIEDFPLPGHNPKYPGLQITINNISAGGDGKPVQTRNKKAKKDEVVEPVFTADEPVIVIESVEFEGPVLTSWPPASHQQILFPTERDLTQPAEEKLYAREVLEKFLTRAYRRPATPADVDVMMLFFDQLRPEYPTLAETMREVLAMALISPDFLYLMEPKEVPDKQQRLDDYELASRLSYFLWSSMPDERLFELASSGQLHEPAVLAAEVERMLADPQSRQFVEHFTQQWFDLAAVDRVAVNPEYYPKFDDRLKAAMRTETQQFFATLLDENLSSLNLLESDFAVLNQPLAEHYGVKGPRGMAFERVALSPEDRRGGLLSQGSFLLANSNGEDSHPIKRAVWLLDRLLDNPPPPPPPDVPALDAEQPDLAKLTLKQQLEVHREKQSCNNCHRGIDPWGVAFENYDAVGRWRTEVVAPKNKKLPVDSTAQLPDGTQVDGLKELKEYLLREQRDEFAQAVVKRLLTYSLGRSLDLSDRQTVEALTEDFTQHDYRLRNLIVGIVQSEPFQTK